MPEFIEKVSPGVDVMKPKIWQRPHASKHAAAKGVTNLTNPTRENQAAISTKWVS
jgi:hypothetical protein